MAGAPCVLSFTHVSTLGGSWYMGMRDAAVAVRCATSTFTVWVLMQRMPLVFLRSTAAAQVRRAFLQL
jgi:hypothetical protein